ncbi:flippase-like domain-containing protein [bacterium]|nr:flippase-like domain-containing protein [candidate division CSSED10-310 bacterium]
MIETSRFEEQPDPTSMQRNEKNNTWKWLRILIGISVSVLFLWLIYQKIDLGKTIQAITRVQSAWLIPAILIYILGIWVRTGRWVLLLDPVKRCSTRRLFPIYIISYMANNILPLRMGDFYRAYFAGRKECISKGATLVTIGVERIFDGLTMLVLLAVSLWFYPVSDPVVRSAVQIGSIVFLGAILLCYGVILKQDWSTWIFQKLLPLTPQKYHDRLAEIFNNLFRGLDSLRGTRGMIAIVLLSLTTWLIEAFSYAVTLWAFGFFGGFHVAVSTMALVNLMIIVPAGPGYFGPFEAACIIMLGQSGYGKVTLFSREMATAYALILHIIVQWIPTTFLGMICMWTEHVGFNEVRGEIQ